MSKVMKILKWIFIIVSLSSILSGCAHKQFQTNEDDTSSFSSNITQLGNQDIDLYYKIINLISEGNVKFSLNNVSEDCIIRIYKLIVNEHPEFFWLGTGYSYETVMDENGKTVTFECAHTSMENVNEKKIRFDNIVKNIINEANKQSTLYERIIYIHDFLIDNTQYDQETYNIMSASKDTDDIYEATTAYGCLINNRAVCSGYSAAFQLLMQELGVQCGRITGRKIGGEDHEWNYIVIEDEYYYVDVTWDDPINGDSEDNKTYEFLCITSDELKETHEIDKEQFIPDCKASKYDYYIYNNLYLEKYDYDEFADIYKKTKNHNGITVKFSSPKELKKALNDLIQDQKIYQIVEGKHSCLYTIGIGERVLSITMR